MARCHANDGDEERNESLIDRRSYLKMGIGAAALAATPALATTRTAASSDRSSAIGGGDGYTRTVPKSAADYTADSMNELHDAASRAESGDVVYVTTDIDAGDESFALPAGVTLAGDRGEGSAGPTLSTEAEHYGMVKAGANSRITGLRFDGPIYTYDASADAYPAGSAIETHGQGVEVDNCEVFGFSWAGVDLNHDAHVHHNHIHHCSRAHLGYGVLVGDGSHPLIEYNYFNYNRHSIAGNDHHDEGTGYEVRFNRFGKDVIHQVVDMHEPGGKSFEVHHNTFVGFTQLDGSREWPGVLVRGTPDDSFDIHHNWFHTTEGPPKKAFYENGQAIAQINQYGEGAGEDSDKFIDVTFHSNHYGPDEPSATIGAPRGDGNGGGSGGDLSNTLTIESDAKVPYEFTVSGDIEKSTTNGATIDASDSVSGSRVSGRVWGGRDSYVFAGEVTDFTKHGPADVTVNGESRYSGSSGGGSHTLTIESDGPKVHYELEVGGGLQKSGARNATFDRGDTISGSKVTGHVWGGRDSYEFTGDVTEFSHNGRVTVYLDGERVDPGTLG